MKITKEVYLNTIKRVHNNGGYVSNIDDHILKHGLFLSSSKKERKKMIKTLSKIKMPWEK